MNKLDQYNAQKILEKFVDAITDKVKHLKNLDTINGLIGAIPILEEVLDIHEDLFGNKTSTNGDVIKAMFPNAKYAECKNVIALHTEYFGVTHFDKEWWNAPYKEGENDI